MTIDEAIKIIDPETSGKALRGHTREEIKKLVDEACVVACDIMRKYKEIKIEHCESVR